MREPLDVRTIARSPWNDVALTFLDVTWPAILGGYLGGSVSLKLENFQEFV